MPRISSKVKFPSNFEQYLGNTLQTAFELVPFILQLWYFANSDKFNSSFVDVCKMQEKVTVINKKLHTSAVLRNPPYCPELIRNFAKRKIE